eukprot:1425905-Ditylum_brightwellii.AAC.1
MRYNKRGRERIIPPKEVDKIREESVINAGDEGFNFNKAKNIVQKHADEKNIISNKLPSNEGGKSETHSGQQHPFLYQWQLLISLSERHQDWVHANLSR